jgi:hypothetical protein
MPIRGSNQERAGLRRPLPPAILLVLVWLTVGAGSICLGADLTLEPIVLSRSHCDPCSEEPIFGCTVFTLSKGNQVFFGGNDDYIKPDTHYWVDPGRPGEYGAIWLGEPDNVQQGVNEVGLAYDANGLPRAPVNPQTGREPVEGEYSSYPIQILRENATVADVVDWVRTHEWHSTMHDQMHFADAGGDAVIISAGADGELVLTRKPPGDGFLVSTNFNVANPSNNYGYPCWRYELAQRELGRLEAQRGALTVEDAAGVLEATHVEAAAGWTVASLLADLQSGKVYLYYFHQFDRPVVLDVAEQLANPPASGPLSRLFPMEVQEEAARRYERILSRAGRCRWLGIGWFGAAAVSLALFLILSKGRHRRRPFWVLMMIVLGPLGLLVWGAAGRGGSTHVGRLALLETAGDVTPTAVAFLAMVGVVLLVPGADSSGLLKIGLILGLPLVMGLLLFHGPLLAATAKMGYLQLIRRRLPHMIVVANLGMAGLNAIAAPLTSLGLSHCMARPFPLAMAGILFAIAALGAAVGGALVWVYSRWAVKRGYRGWSALVSADAECALAGWRQLKWWIALSLVAQVAGILASVGLQSLLRG